MNTVCSLNVVFFLKILQFFWSLPDLPHWREQSPEFTSKFYKKTQYSMNTLYIHICTFIEGCMRRKMDLLYFRLSQHFFFLIQCNPLSLWSPLWRISKVGKAIKVSLLLAAGHFSTTNGSSVPAKEQGLQNTGCSGKKCVYHNSLQPLPRLRHRCKRPSKPSMRVYSHSYWLVIFCVTHSSRVLARERWQRFENSWKKHKI